MDGWAEECLEAWKVCPSTQVKTSFSCVIKNLKRSNICHGMFSYLRFANKDFNRVLPEGTMTPLYHSLNSIKCNTIQYNAT